MLLRLTSNIPTFRAVDFVAGINFIIAEGKINSRHRGSANSVGKSSVFRLVDFLLGGNLTEKEVPTKIFPEAEFTLALTIGEGGIFGDSRT